MIVVTNPIVLVEVTVVGDGLITIALVAMVDGGGAVETATVVQVVEIVVEVEVEPVAEPEVIAKAVVTFYVSGEEDNGGAR